MLILGIFVCALSIDLFLDIFPPYFYLRPIIISRITGKREKKKIIKTSLPLVKIIKFIIGVN